MSSCSLSVMYLSVQKPGGPINVNPGGRLASSISVLFNLVRLRPGFFFCIEECILSGMSKVPSDKCYWSLKDVSGAECRDIGTVKFYSTVVYSEYI